MAWCTVCALSSHTRNVRYLTSQIMTNVHIYIRDYEYIIISAMRIIIMHVITVLSPAHCYENMKLMAEVMLILVTDEMATHMVVYIYTQTHKVCNK